MKTFKFLVSIKANDRHEASRKIIKGLGYGYSRESIETIHYELLEEE